MVDLTFCTGEVGRGTHAGRKFLKFFFEDRFFLSAGGYLRGFTYLKWMTMKAFFFVRFFLVGMFCWGVSNRMIAQEEAMVMAKNYLDSASIYIEKWQVEPTLYFANKALSISLKQNSEFDSLTSKAYFFIGIALDKKIGQHGEARAFIEKALQIQIVLFGEDNLTTADYYWHLGASNALNGDRDEALKCYLKCLEIRKKLLGEHHDLVIKLLSNIGLQYKIKDEYKSSLEYFQKALMVQMEMTGDSSIEVADRYYSIGTVYEELKDTAKTLENFSKWLTLKIKNLGEQHQDVANAYEKIGDYFLSLQDYDNAFQCYKKNLEICLETYGEGHLWLSYAYRDLGIVCTLRQDYKTADECYRKAFVNLDKDNRERKVKGYDFFRLYAIREVCEHAIRSLIEAATMFPDSFDIAQTFVYTERGKGSRLKGAYNTMQVKPENEKQAFLIEKAKTLETSISELEIAKQIKLFNGLSEADSTVIRISLQIYELNKEYRNLKDSLYKFFPAYHKAIFELSNLTVSQVQNELIEEDQSLIEYVYGDSSIFIFRFYMKTCG